MDGSVAASLDRGGELGGVCVCVCGGGVKKELKQMHNHHASFCSAQRLQSSCVPRIQLQ